MIPCINQDSLNRAALQITPNTSVEPHKAYPSRMVGFTSHNIQIASIELTQRQVILVGTGQNINSKYLKALEHDQTREILERIQLSEEGTTLGGFQMFRKS